MLTSNVRFSPTGRAELLTAEPSNRVLPGQCQPPPAPSPIHCWPRPDPTHPPSSITTTSASVERLFSAVGSCWHRVLCQAETQQIQNHPRHYVCQCQHSICRVVFSPLRTCFLLWWVSILWISLLSISKFLIWLCLDNSTTQNTKTFSWHCKYSST